MSGAGQILAETVLVALRMLEGLNGVYDGPPLSAAFPYAVIEAGPERDWSHKSGEGRELRLSVQVHDKGERPARLRALVAEIEAMVRQTGPELAGWRLVTLVFVRETMLRSSGATWTAAIDYRARLLRT
jgi:hypothetical protein